VLGDVIAYADEKNGHIIQDVCPVPGAEQLQENTGSCLLELHSEDGFHPNKPHFLALYCLRADHDRRALTVACGIRAALPALETHDVVALRQPWFRIRVSSSFTGRAGVNYSAPMPVLSGSTADPDLCVDFHAMEAITPEGADALAALRCSMLGSLVGAVLEPGDMLIVDNRKAVHGRTDFRPRYDSQDRWLRRCFAVTDIRASDWARPPSSRVHQPLSGIGLVSR
jgi:L-asparagine oxygenase